MLGSTYIKLFVYKVNKLYITSYITNTHYYTDKINFTDIHKGSIKFSLWWRVL